MAELQLLHIVVHWCVVRFSKYFNRGMKEKKDFTKNYFKSRTSPCSFVISEDQVISSPSWSVLHFDMPFPSRWWSDRVLFFPIRRNDVCNFHISMFCTYHLSSVIDRLQLRENFPSCECLFVSDGAGANFWYDSSIPFLQSGSNSILHYNFVISFLSRFTSLVFNPTSSARSHTKIFCAFPSTNRLFRAKPTFLPRHCLRFRP